MINPEDLNQLFEWQKEKEELESRIMSLETFQADLFKDDGFKYEGDYLISHNGVDYLATFYDSKFDRLTHIEKLIYTA